MERLVIIGPGRLGLALGTALIQADAEVSLRYLGRHPEPPGHPLFTEGRAEYRYGLEVPPHGTSAVLLTVPDGLLREMAEVLAGRGDPPPGTPVLHCSGALGGEPLEALHHRGYRVGTLHPLQAIANPVTGAQRLMGSSFAISGEPEALAAARRIVSALGGRWIQVPTVRRPLYHASAVMASNYLVVLVRVAARLLEEAGAEPEEAEDAIVALARGALENVAEYGLHGALTGPVSRGDVDVVGLHLRTLSPEDATLYAELGTRALEMSKDRLPAEVVGAMNELFRKAT
jgi:predicted short-subunit dehydrogenase-like oxidoreductase (DUF2520 family)